MLLQLIRKWLKKRLDINLNISPEYFVETTKDGTLLSQILCFYNVIDAEELESIEETHSPTASFENHANYIRYWLQRIDLELSDDDIHEIVHGEGTAAASLFYELYMKLENRKKLIYPPKINKHYFKVEKVGDHEMDDAFFESNPLCEPLLKEWDVINWERDHLKAIMSKYVKSRDEYNEYLEEKKIKTLNKETSTKLEDALLFMKPEKTDYTYEELIAQQRDVLAMEPFEPNMNEAKRIMRQIRKRNKQRAERTAFRIELQHELMADVWKKIDEIEEQHFDKVVCEKLMKQSIHEKEIAEKLLDIRRRKEIMIQNRKIQDELESKRRDEEFVKKLFEDSLEERLKFHQERMKLIAEHRRLYEQKLRLKALKHQKLCGEALNDIINLALKTAEYKEMYGTEPDKYIRKNWATLFIKQQPIFDLIAPSQELKLPHEDICDELEEIYRREIKRQDILDEQDLDDYIRFGDIWMIEEGLEEFVTTMELGMNCLGFAVHKLLLKKYPLPIPEKPDLSQDIDISVCANNVSDLSRLPLLQRLLDLRNVKVLRMEDAIDFCIKAYETELTTEYDEPYPEEEHLKELTPKKAKSEKGKKGKKEKGNKKGKKEKGNKKGSKKGKKETGKTAVVGPTFEEKQAQTPRLFPWEKIIFSNKAKLGRIAKQLLGQEDTLDDRLLVEMFIEYLLSIPDLKGWVLINYPNNYEQAALLEEALSGKPVPKAYYDKVLNKESLSNIQVEEEEIEEESLYCSIETEQEAVIQEEEQDKSTTIEESTEEFVLERKLTGRSETPSGGTSGISGITVLDTYRISSEERIAHLLPDLKPLAYSEEEAEEEENDGIEEKSKTCICVCNTVTDAIAIVTSDVEEEEAQQDTEQDCICYLINTKEPEEQVEVENVTIQTDILGLAQETGADGEEPLERRLAEDIHEEKRISKIVPNPRPLEKAEYNTVLTAYIKILPKEETDEKDKDYQIPIFEELDKKDGLEKFYCDQGCFYLLQYEEFGAETVKCLAKMIIGDYSLPLKTSVEIFGERYKQAMLEDGDHVITKKGKKEKKEKKKKKKKGTKGSKSDTKTKSSKGNKSPKSKKSGKKDKKGKKGKVKVEEIIEHEDKEVQVPIIEEVEEEELPEPRAGEPDWDYINLRVPQEMELSLANLWDNFEENYIRNFKDLFFNKRVLLNTIVPYLAKVRQSMDQFIGRSDQKQYYLREFQKTLNEIGLDLRNDPQTKSELFCRIDEFKEKLLGICDVKMRESEEERRNFIRQNWLFHQFCQMTNNSAVAYQLEIDRLVDTLQFLSDYYIAVITKSLKESYEFHKQVLPKHDCHEETSEEFNTLFIDIDSQNEETTEFHKYMEETKNLASGFVESMKALAEKPVTDMKKIFAPKEKKEKKEKKKFEPDEDVKENADRIFEEWECAIRGEFARMNLHLDVIRNEAFRRFNDVILWIKKIFEAIYEDISLRYENELASVHKACELLMHSVEQEVIIQPELTFEGDQLAEIQITLFPETLVIPEESYKDGTFKIEQLEYLVKILFDLARSGYILKKTFLLLIQDILYQDDIDEESDTPVLWRKLSTGALNSLIRKLFDDEKYLYWKDFIVCNLMIPFPTREELMEVRKQFRSCDPDLTERVTRDEFNRTNFWFQNDESISDQNLYRLNSIIFRMYQTGEDEFNYTAFLLDFCKDKDQILGFVKALELSLGKFICYDEEVGNTFVAQILEDRILFEQEKKEHEERVILAKKAVSMLVDRMLDLVEGPEGFDLREVEEAEGSIPSIKGISFSEKSSNKSELSEGKIITEQKFSYAQIGFESRDDTELCYFLPLDLVLVVVGTEVSWNYKVDEPPNECFRDEIVGIYEECRNVKFNNVVLAHEFLNCGKLRTLFETTNKFMAHNPVRLVKRILYDQSESVGEEEEGSKYDEASTVENNE